MVALPIILAVLSAMGAAYSWDAGNEGPAGIAYLFLGLILGACTVGFGAWAVALLSSS